MRCWIINSTLAIASDKEGLEGQKGDNGVAGINGIDGVDGLGGINGIGIDNIEYIGNLLIITITDGDVQSFALNQQ